MYGYFALFGLYINFQCYQAFDNNWTTQQTDRLKRAKYFDIDSVRIKENPDFTIGTFKSTDILRISPLKTSPVFFCDYDVSMYDIYY